LLARFNSDSTTNYITSTSNSNTAAWTNNSMAFGDDADNGASTSLSVTNVYDYANATTWKIADTLSVVLNPTTPANPQWQRRIHIHGTTSAITTITLFPGTGNFTSGSALIYGVN
jgi:hypothetical protein